jgi:hypothetical protein
MRRGFDGLFHGTDNLESGGTDGQGNGLGQQNAIQTSQPYSRQRLLVSDEEPVQDNPYNQEATPEWVATYGFGKSLLPEIERIFGELRLRLSGSSPSSL